GELDRADPRVPIALPIAVAPVDPLRRTLAVRRAAERFRLRAHQRLGEVLHHRPQQIRVSLLELLAQPTRDVHRVLDHRAPPRACLRQGLREDDAVVSYHPDPRPSLRARLRLALHDSRGRQPQPARTPRAGTLLSGGSFTAREECFKNAVTYRRDDPIAFLER